MRAVLASKQVQAQKPIETTDFTGASSKSVCPDRFVRRPRDAHWYIQVQGAARQQSHNLNLSLTPRNKNESIRGRTWPDVFRNSIKKDL